MPTPPDTPIPPIFARTNAKNAPAPATHHTVPNTTSNSTSNTASNSISLTSWALIFLVPALWGINYLIARKAPAVIAPHALACARWMLASCLLCLFSWSELKAKRHLIWHERWHILALGLFGMWICGAWVYTAARTTNANNIALIYTLSPVFIVLAAALFLKEPLQKRQWLGVILAFLGLTHIVIQGQWQQLTAIQFVMGDLWMLGCAIAWAMYSIALKRWPSAFSPLARLVLIAFAGTLINLPLALMENTFAWLGSHTTFGLEAGALILAAALFPSTGAYLGYSLLQKKIGVARTSLVLYLGPLYAAGLAWFVLAEPLHDYHAIGALVILPGIYLASLSPAPYTQTASKLPPHQTQFPQSPN